MLVQEEVQVVEGGDAKRTWPVNVQAIEKSTLTPTIQLFGEVISSGTAKFSSILNAKVRAVHVKPGDYVTAGDVIIELDTRNIETRISQIEAGIERTEAELEYEFQSNQTNEEILVHEKQLLELATQTKQRIEPLKSRNLDSQSRFERAQTEEKRNNIAVTARLAAIREHKARVQRLEAELGSAKAQLENARQDFADSIIVAPYSGRILELYVAVGNQVSVGTSLAEIYNDKDVEVLTIVPSQFLPQIRDLSNNSTKFSATATVDGVDLKLRFDRLAATVDPNKGGIDAHFQIENGSFYPELGRTIDLTMFLYPVENAVAIPYQSVYGQDRVYKVVDDQLKSASIERFGQIAVNGKQMIVAKSSELDADDLLVTTPLTNAVDGLTVEPILVN